ncbi:hypothetical protein [Streptomyces sp. IBSBF 3136]|uniref:hypothetical protein n=1 Tax=Streptomyces sp. IBSBF 3136 TaxID=2903524 RepID=UPI002FDBF2FD
MSTSGTGTGPAPVEERLRAALAARALSVGPADLRPLRPPSATGRPRPAVLRRTAVGLLALAAAAALVFLAVRGGPDRPAEPAHRPRPTTGTPTTGNPTTGSPSPVPSPARPTTSRPSPSVPGP